MSGSSTFGPFAKTARKALERTILSAVNGLSYVVDGAAKPTLGDAAKDLVHQNGKVRLWRVRPLATDRVELGDDEFDVELSPPQPVPILLIPPFMVHPYVYDLRPDHSMVRMLRNAGFDVFVLDFGVPGRDEEQLRLDDYVLDFVPTAVEQAIKASGKDAITLCGYCMGGIFAIVHQAMFRDPRVKNIVTIGAPVDFEKMGMISMVSRLAMVKLPGNEDVGDERMPLVDAVMDVMGNVPGFMAGMGFRLLGGTRAITSYASLLMNLHDEQYVRSFDAVDTWLWEMVAFPKEAFKQTLKEVVHGNRMLKNDLEFGGRRADLHAVTVPVLAFAGRGDTVATPASTAGILDLLGSRDATYREVAGGHIGVLAGSAAPVEVWQPMIDWLRERNARTSASAGEGGASKAREAAGHGEAHDAPGEGDGANDAPPTTLRSSPPPPSPAETRAV